MDTSTFQGLREYYHVHSLIVWRVFCELEEHIDERAQRIVDELDENDQRSVRRASFDLHYLQVQMANTMRYAMLPRFLGLLERVIKGLCRITDSISYESVDKRSWFNSHIEFLNNRDADLSPIQSAIDKIRHINTLRNCIVHANGEISQCKNPGLVRESIEKIDSAGEYQDGFLVLGDQVIPEAQSANSEVLMHLFTISGFPLDRGRWY